MSFEVEVPYENGVLKPDEALPLREHERVTVRLVTKKSRVDEMYGRMRWTGDPDILRKLAEEPE